MGFFTSVVWMFAIASFVMIYFIKSKANSSRQKNKITDQLLGRIDKLEERIANLETVLLDIEKSKPFDELAKKQ